LIGRDKELELLNSLCEEDKSKLVVIRKDIDDLLPWNVALS